MDMAALANPTRRKRDKRDSDESREPTVEERTWPDEARVLSIMAHGFTYDESWHMSFRDYRRYAGLAAAWSIPRDQREEPVKRGGSEDRHLLL